ncbi:MAG: glycine zipper 2TM domain-containing protein [Caulobacteraceae bacterium]
MNTFKLSACALALAAGALASPAAGQTYYRHHHYYRHHSYGRRTCGAERRSRANTGTVIGAVGGGLLGNSVSHGGGRLGGTLIGAGAGAVVGHQIGKHSVRC